MNPYTSLVSSIMEHWHASVDEHTKRVFLEMLVDGISDPTLSEGPVVWPVALTELIPVIFECGRRIGWDEGRENIIRLQDK